MRNDDAVMVPCAYQLLEPLDVGVQVRTFGYSWNLSLLQHGLTIKTKYQMYPDVALFLHVMRG